MGFINKSFMKWLVAVMFLSSVLMMLMTESYFFLWVLIEFNMVLLVPMVSVFNSSNVTGMMKYFIIQSISSNLFLFFMILNYNFCVSILFTSYMIFVSMWIKMGLFPFSQWYYQVTDNLDWLVWILINTTQKLVPLWVISHNFYSHFMVMGLVIVNSVYSSIEIWVQTSFRWLINSSSLNHMSWMFLSMSSSLEIWKIYFIVYLVMSFMMFLVLKDYNLTSLLSDNFTYISMMFSCLMILNFMGMPPFLGFLPKMMIMKFMNYFMVLLILILNNLLLLVIYISLMKMMLNMVIHDKIEYISYSYNLINLILSVTMIYFMVFL